MHKLRQFIKNGLLLSFTSAFLQAVGILFNSYITGKIGADGMGVYQLIMSVYRFAVTFSLGGIGLAATRVVAEQLAKNSYNGVKKAVRKSVLYSLAFGLTGGILLFSLAPFISGKLLNNNDTLLSLRLLSGALPFVSMSSAMSGYFNAIRRVSKSASAQIFEQFIRITAAIMLFELFAPDGIEAACAAVVLGGTFSEAMSCLYLWLMYRREKRGFILNGKAERGLGKKIFTIAFPMAMSSYLRSGLVTVEHMLIPKGLQKSGQSYSTAMAAYGTVTGMALPTVLFPASILASFAGLLIPEMAEFKTLQKEGSIKRVAGRVIKFAIMFSVCAAGVLLAFSGLLGEVLFKSDTAGTYIKILAPLVTVMYLDTAVDGMLKGLNEQMATMRYNIIDALTCVVLVWILVPQMGVKGYLLVIFISEIINAALSVNRLITVTEIEVNFKDWVIKPVLAATLSCGIIRLILINTSGILPLISGIILSISGYAILLRMFGAISFEVKNLVKRK